MQDLQKGFVKKVINKENRRKVCIIATGKGVKTIKKMESDNRFKKITASMSKNEAIAFINSLAKPRGDN